MRNLTVRYAGNVALSSVSISVPAGKWSGLVGANGAGKSTLVNALAGWSRGRAIVSGKVNLEGQDIECSGGPSTRQPRSYAGTGRQEHLC